MARIFSVSCNVVILFIIVNFHEVVDGKAQLWINFVKFDNPGGRGANGHCCDGRAVFCFSPCDHYFQVCVDNNYGSSGANTCAYGRIVTGTTGDSNSINFRSSIGGTSNPMIFNFESWPGVVRLKVGVMDKDDNEDDVVDLLKQDLTMNPDRGQLFATKHILYLRSRTTLTMEVKLYCSPGSFGNKCSVTCDPRNDATAGYICDFYSGRKVCLEGWTGLSCDVSVDDCRVHHCENGAACVDGHRRYTCRCPPGFQGQYCETNIDECQSSPCQNNGACLDDINRFRCTCDPRWTGVTCQDRNACYGVTCQNGGMCVNLNSDYECSCSQGFVGRHCETEVDECQSSPCQNNGTCFNEVGRFRCQCSAGWDGDTCLNDVDECASSPCVRASQCENLNNDFACLCEHGYTGKLCDTDIDECSTQPCQHGGNCTNYAPGFSCACAPGYHGVTCEDDVDECQSLNPCSQGSTCLNTPGSYNCLCAPDFTGRSCKEQIDHCIGQVCENNGSCVDDVNDFLCACAEGFTGRKCEVYIDRCWAEPCQHGGGCRDPGFGHELQCHCAEGWSGPLCEQDIDECQQHPCANEGTCENIPGGLRCLCPDVWTGRFCHEDVNECLQTVGSDESNTTADVSEAQQEWCQHSGACANADGGYMCVCLNGWQGPRCQDDVDECFGHPCQHKGVCVNTQGGFTCDCPQGFTGKFCEEDVNECVTIPCNDTSYCYNIPGGFLCLCPLGWQGDGCKVDVDECVDGVQESVYCSDHSQAVPEASSLSSSSNNSNNNNNSGTPMDNDSPETTSNSEVRADWTPPPVCAVPANVSLACDDGGGLSCSVPLLARAFAVECQNNGSCHNGLGDFSCSCPQGWTGQFCEEDVDECLVGVMERSGNGDEAQGPVSPFGRAATSTHETLPIATTIAITPPDTTPWDSILGQLPVIADTDTISTACYHEGQCANLPGGYTCACPAGWTGPRCQVDVDECSPAAGSNPCQHDGACSNVAGGFRCRCPSFWQGEVCAEERDECADSPCSHNASCIGRPPTRGGGVQCVCPRGWTGPTCLQDRDECQLRPCFHGSTCLNELGSFRCVCPQGSDGLDCSSSTLFDAGVTLPMYLEGHLGPQEEKLLRAGAEEYLEKYGDFRHDVDIRVYLQTNTLSVWDNTPVTQVDVTIVVENVTLSGNEVADLFNRVPVSLLQSYLPAPLVRDKIVEIYNVDGSTDSAEGFVIPWFSVVFGALAAFIIAIIAVIIVLRRNQVTRWWLRRKGPDTQVIFTHNGRGHRASGDSSNVVDMTSSDLDDVDALTTQPRSGYDNAIYMIDSMKNSSSNTSSPTLTSTTAADVTARGLDDSAPLSVRATGSEPFVPSGNKTTDQTGPTALPPLPGDPAPTSLSAGNREFRESESSESDKYERPVPCVGWTFPPLSTSRGSGDVAGMDVPRACSATAQPRSQPALQNGEERPASLKKEINQSQPVVDSLQSADPEGDCPYSFPRKSSEARGLKGEVGCSSPGGEIAWPPPDDDVQPADPDGESPYSVPRKSDQALDPDDEASSLRREEMARSEPVDRIQSPADNRSESIYDIPRKMQVH